jgi:WD40 repeat protein
VFLEVMEVTMHATSRRLSVLAVCVIASSGCGDGVRRNPLGSPGSGGVPAASSDPGGGATGGGHAAGGTSGGPAAAGTGGGPATAATGGHAGATGGDAAMVNPPPSGPLSGSWLPCGQLGDGGPANIALSADGQTLVASFVWGPMIAYRTSGRQVIAQIGPDTLRSVSPAVSADGGLVASDYPVQVWQVGRASPLFTLPATKGTPAFSPDGKQLLVTSQDASLSSTVEVWDIASGQMVRGAGPGDTAVFANGGSQIVTHTHQDQTIRFTGAGTAAPAITLPLDESAAHRLSPIGTMVVGYGPAAPGGVGVSMQAYHLPDGRRLWSVTADRAESFLTFSPDGRQIVSYSPTGHSAPTTHAFDTSTGAEITLPGVGSHDDLIGIVLGPEGKPGIVATGSGIFGLTGDPKDPVTVPDSIYPLPGGGGLPVASVAISGDGQWLATGAIEREQSTVVWNLPARKVQRTLPTGDRSSTVIFTADSRQVVRAWDSIDAWSIATGDQAWGFLPPANVPETGGLRWFAAVSPSEDRVATNYGTGVTIFSTNDPNITTQLDVGQPYAALAFSPDGQTLATSGPMLWRVSDGQKLWPTGALPPPPAPASGSDPLPDNWVAFSPDGTLILVSEFLPDGVAWLTDFQSYRTLTKIYRASDGALVRDMGNSLRRRPAFSADGAWIVAGSRVYPTLSGAPVQLSPASVFDSASAFGPDGTIAVGGTDGVTRLYCPQ